MFQLSSAHVRKIQKFSVYARGICSVLLVLYALCTGYVLYVLAHEAASDYVGLKIAADRMGIGSATAMGSYLAFLGFGSLCSGVIVWMLRRVFGNLARGQIFHRANVREIRHVAFAVLLIGMSKIIWVIGKMALATQGLFDREHFAVASSSFPPGLLMTLALAGIVYLVSWIVRAGLDVSDEAAEL